MFPLASRASCFGQVLTFIIFSALGHLDKLRENGAGDPATDEPFGATALNLKSAIAGETHEYTDMFVIGLAQSSLSHQITHYLFFST
jgi:hypothetical protein